MDLIKVYLNNLTENDSKIFLKNNNIELNEKEFKFLFNEIKNNYKKIIIEDENEINYIKANINNESFKKLFSLLNKYKKYL